MLTIWRLLLYYSLVAIPIGVIYTDYWVKYKMSDLTICPSKIQKIEIIFIVFVMASMGSPLALYELFKNKIK